MLLQLVWASSLCIKKLSEISGKIINRKAVRSKLVKFLEEILPDNKEITYNDLRVSVKSMCDSCSEDKKSRNKRQSKPWMTGELLRQIADRDNAFKKSKNNPSNIMYRLDYLRLRKSVNLNIKIAKETSIKVNLKKHVLIWKKHEK